MEQRFHLEAAFREIDAARILTSSKTQKANYYVSKNEKAVAREVMVQHRKEIEFSTSKKFDLASYEGEYRQDWLERVGDERCLQWWTL